MGQQPCRGGGDSPVCPAGAARPPRGPPASTSCWRSCGSCRRPSGSWTTSSRRVRCSCGCSPRTPPTSNILPCGAGPGLAGLEGWGRSSPGACGHPRGARCVKASPCLLLDPPHRSLRHLPGPPEHCGPLRANGDGHQSPPGDPAPGLRPDGGERGAPRSLPSSAEPLVNPAWAPWVSPRTVSHPSCLFPRLSRSP